LLLVISEGSSKPPKEEIVLNVDIGVEKESKVDGCSTEEELSIGVSHDEIEPMRE